MGRIAALFLAGLVACSSGGGDSCTEKGCEAGLECAADVDKCIPADCTPGLAECVCSNGQCVAGTHCAEGICMPGGTTLDPSTGSGSSGPVVTESSGSASTTTSASEDASSSVSADSGPGTTEESGESVSSGSSGEPTCADERDCEACLACAVAVIGPCADDSMTCADDEQCQGLQTCVANCAAMGDGGQCVNQCCGLFENGNMPPYSDLAMCMSDACGELCPDFGC